MRRGGVIAAVLIACLGGARPAMSQNAPYDAAGPLTEARLFGEGVLSTRDDEFGGTFTPDGKTCYFSKSVPRSYLYTICVTRFERGRWSTPEIAEFSGRYRDFDPVLSPDGTKLLFASDRPVEAAPKHDYDIWMVTRIGDGWSEPVSLGAPIDTEANEHFASIAANGTIYFSSDRDGAMGGPGDSDVYRARLVDGRYTTAEHLGDTVSSAAFELDCVIAPDESFLLVGAYGRRGGLGNYDIWVSRNHAGVWAPAENLGPKVNSAARDYSPRISPDGRYLFFTSERDFTFARSANRLTYRELADALSGTLNGSGNIYQIDLAAVGLSLVHKGVDVRVGHAFGDSRRSAEFLRATAR